MKILVATGWTAGFKATKSSYIITQLYKKNMAKAVYLKRVKDYPMALFDCFSSAADGRLIVGGGQDDYGIPQNNVYEYHADTDKWKSLPKMITPRSGAKSCYAGKHLFVSGGIFFLGGVFDKRSVELDSVEYLKIDATSQSKRWTMCRTPLPLKLHSHEIVTIGDNIYLTGGINDEGIASSKAFLGKTNSDGDDIVWRPLPPMLHKREGHFSFALQTKLYIAGGGGQGGNTCEFYDPETDKWTLMPHKLSCDKLTGPCATSDGEGKVIITGSVYDGKYSLKVTSYDLENGFRVIDNFKMIMVDRWIAGHVALPLM